MDGTDAFKRSGPGAGSNPFADRSYSDQFVRSATQPLGRRQTRPLQITPDVFSQQLTSADEQIQLCRTILDRFGPRVKLLKAASEQAKKAAGVPAPPPAAPAKKGLKPPAAKKPLAPPQAPAGPLSPQDKQLVDKLAKRLVEKVDLARRAAIAVHQFEEASRSVAETHAKLNQARSMDPEQGWALLESLEITKLQGRVYPICNFYEVFKDDEAFWQLFPPPTSPTGPTTTKGRTFGN